MRHKINQNINVWCPIADEASDDDEDAPTKMDIYMHTTPKRPQCYHFSSIAPDDQQHQQQRQ